jgi:hypothetical protein
MPRIRILPRPGGVCAPIEKYQVRPGGSILGTHRLIRDRDGKYPGLFDAVLADAGIEVVLTGVRMPRMNAIMERSVQTCHRELLDRTLIRNQLHGTACERGPRTIEGVCGGDRGGCQVGFGLRAQSAMWPTTWGISNRLPVSPVCRNATLLSTGIRPLRAWSSNPASPLPV